MSDAKSNQTKQHVLHLYHIELYNDYIVIGCLNAGQEMELVRRNPQEGCRDSARVEGYVRCCDVISGCVPGKYSASTPYFIFLC
jgi:hypothetical protein